MSKSVYCRGCFSALVEIEPHEIPQSVDVADIPDMHFVFVDKDQLLDYPHEEEELRVIFATCFQCTTSCSDGAYILFNKDFQDYLKKECPESTVGRCHETFSSGSSVP